MNGGFSQQVRVLESAMATATPACIDTGSEPGAWATALAHSPTLHCACCGLPAHSCAVVQEARAEALADTADGSGGLGDYPPELLLS